jgi:abequosyltransferase
MRYEKKPLLSICIPTYNRRPYLEKTVSAIISDPCFGSDDVELVISDNASSDDTRKVIEDLAEKNPRIRYFRNDENIHDRNFPKSIELAKGTYRKLLNDTAVPRPGVILRILGLVNENLENKTPIVFLNGNIARLKKDLYQCRDFDSFINVMSFWTTWIGAFGVWEQDLETLGDLYQGCELSLWQTTTLFKLISLKKSAIVYNAPSFDVQETGKKDLSYGLIKVFGENYLSILAKYLGDGEIGAKTYEIEKRRLLFNFFSSWVANAKTMKTRFEFGDNESGRTGLKGIYGEKAYYPLFVAVVNARMLVRRLKELGKPR